MGTLANNYHVLNWINSLKINVHDCGYAELGTEWQRSNVCSPYTRLYYIHHGEGFAYKDGQYTRLRAGYMYLIPIGYRYNYGCDDHMDQLYFHINITLPSGLDLFAQCSRVYELPIDRAEIERLVMLYRSPDMADALSIACCLYRDVAAFITKADMEARPPFSYSDMLQRLFPIIRQRLSAKLTIADLASEMNVSQSTLTKRFNTEMEMTLGQYLDSMLCQRCQQMLLFSDDSIGVISDKLEFCDQFYFCRYFKKHQGETPSQYRKRMKLSIR